MRIIWGHAHRRWWHPCVPCWYPPNPAIPNVPPQKAALHARKALILRTFCPSVTKIVWFFGGIYRHVFRGYRWKNSIFPPLYPTHPKPYFEYPVTPEVNIQFRISTWISTKKILRTKVMIITLPLPCPTTRQAAYHVSPNQPHIRAKSPYIKGFTA